MTRRVRFEDEATLELLEAAIWYDTRRTGLGTDFVETVDAALNVIRRWPDAAPRVRGVAEPLNVRRAPVPRFVYGIIYVQTLEVIRVIAIAHNARESRYWLERLK